ncbi:MAG: Prochlorococcus phage, partial [Bacteroidota bacterium]
PVGKINITEENIKEIKEADLVIVSDYNKGFLGHDDLLKIAKNGKLTLLDSKKILTDEIVKEFTFIKLNESEMSNNLHISDKSNIIVTLGARGAMINNKTFALKNPKETIDVSGAGDTFVAAFGITYLETKDLNASISFANFLSCAVVGKRGVSLPFD